ncbi:WecB/TagA/CpsF family glycosyltransferase [Pisciglobus halotolerans]|uniref:N-acetylglucosaminyldiphosphoundecaprenol N-acetyl-beta-D-mannosaminyltransferase n=1 Tax=Pisciglobus halotolerans TaxID=745365 RepID=A0A1I3CQ73_9LACT|nr:WecB/TagA/CpsF family glycosyltransferase [Pisciglobus halotolerans]SFH76654.1 N-acetylglucosaminyldiphosphoundecaprenol N-acetyl-beta-D-mannosaminyltransferase [Pisciglobus halotolerans]
MEREKVNVIGIVFDNYTKKEFIQFFLERINKKEKTFVVTANPEIVMFAKNNPFYYKIIKKANYVVPDGVGVIKGAQLLGSPLAERVPGFELMLALLQEANLNQLRVYFLGAKQEVVEKAVAQVRKDYPLIQIAGYHDGYFDLKDKKMINEVQGTQPDIVFVALGFPKQEKWISQYLETAEKGILMGVGGSFDVLSGNARRAPKFFLDHNIEWFYRLLKQPSRFGRMMALPRFLVEVYKQKIRTKR